MTIGLTSDLDTSRFVSMCRDLEKLSGKSFGEVLKVTAVQILKFCIKHTRAASRASILLSISKRHSMRFTFASGEVISESKRHPGDISFLDISTARAGRPPKFIAGGKSWHDMSNFHWSDVRWAKFQVLLAEANARTQGKKAGRGADEKAALGSRGLAKHSWFQVAEAIGIGDEVDAPSWVKSAKPKDGSSWQNGSARFALEAATAYIEMRNDYPAVVKMGGQTLINYAIISRAKAFEREVELGVFRDMKTRAARYPGLFVSSSS